MDGPEKRSSRTSGGTGFRIEASAGRRADEDADHRTSGKNSRRSRRRADRPRAPHLCGAGRRAPAPRGRVRGLPPRCAERGSVTVEHAIGLIAVVGMIGLVVCAAQASITSTALCQAVRDGARAASIGGKDPRAVAAASFSATSSAPASFAVVYDEEWVEVSGSATYRGPVGWAGGTATCAARTLVEGAVP